MSLYNSPENVIRNTVRCGIINDALRVCAEMQREQMGHVSANDIDYNEMITQLKRLRDSL